ncbi:hypothetical protein BaOVIS_007080 [Babesia ovis]|uniref:Uncharacterized protein n=1 Tax=Babesia ovis TaxID=5869 RepID=A0A9W5TCT4_BABOV|nr:hypothetical protein BaOVIS_007080 [Babesia ovis]
MTIKGTIIKLWAPIAILSLMAVSAESKLFGYFRGECDALCKQCKYECEARFKAGTFKRWMCKGKCRFNTTK